MARSRKRRKSKKASEAVFLIPITFNDGSTVPDATLLSFFDELYTTFHAWTCEGMVQGAYKMTGGEKRTEKLLKVSVLLDNSQVATLRKLISQWCQKLDQEVMLLMVTETKVHFVSPRGNEDQQ